MNPKRGRPCRVDKEDIINTIISFKDRVIVLNKVTSKCDSVWSDISVSLRSVISPLSLYTIVTCNKYGIRNKLTHSVEDTNVTDNGDISNTVSDASLSRYSESFEPINFTITITPDEFEGLIVFKSYKRMQRNKVRRRLWRTLRPGIWEDFITNKIWDAVRLKCGFRFHNHYISSNDISGYINGKYINL